MSRTIWQKSTWQYSHGDSAMDFYNQLCDLPQDHLADLAFNDLLNGWCGDVADYRDTDHDLQGHGKRLPYIGWYWRSVDFAKYYISIGDCGDFIGFMENNKWDYPERSLTEHESREVIDRLWAARKAGGAGGSVAESHAARDKVLTELWDWMQDLTIPAREW